MGTNATDGSYSNVAGITNGNGVNALFNVDVISGSVTNVGVVNSGKLYVFGNTVTILGTQIGGFNNAVNTFSDNYTTQTGTTGTYLGLATTGGTGSNATFDIYVSPGDIITSIILDNQGFGYTNGDQLVVLGSLFGGVDGVDDLTMTITSIVSDNITITVDGLTPNPSVYELYTCNIFKNANLTNRLSYYDGADFLTIKNINE